MQKTEGDRRANHAELTAAEEDKIASSQVTIEKNLIRQGDLGVKVDGGHEGRPRRKEEVVGSRQGVGSQARGE